MNDYNTIGDTAYWRLAIYITRDSISAWIKNTGVPNEPARKLMESNWDPQEGKVLDKIEAAVYDNPSVLDDFECDVVVETPDILLVPDALTDDEEGESNLQTLYNQVYNADSDDIMADNLPGEVTMLYTLEQGLKPFLTRTFPGARVSSSLSILINNCLMHEVSAGGFAFAHVRKGWVDIVVLKNGRIMNAASHPWHAPADVAYHVLNLCEIADPSRKSLEIKLTGLKEVRDEVLPVFEKFGVYAESLTLPNLPDFDILPLSVAYCTTRKPKS